MPKTNPNEILRENEEKRRKFDLLCDDLEKTKEVIEKLKDKPPRTTKELLRRKCLINKYNELLNICEELAAAHNKNLEKYNEQIIKEKIAEQHKLEKQQREQEKKQREQQHEQARQQREQEKLRFISEPPKFVEYDMPE